MPTIPTGSTNLTDAALKSVQGNAKNLASAAKTPSTKRPAPKTPKK